MTTQQNKLLGLYLLHIAGLIFFLVPSVFAILGAVFINKKDFSTQDHAFIKKLFLFFLGSVIIYAVGFGIICNSHIDFLNVNLGFVVLAVSGILLGYQVKDTMAEIIFGNRNSPFSLEATLTKQDPAYYIGK